MERISKIPESSVRRDKILKFFHSLTRLVEKHNQIQGIYNIIRYCRVCHGFRLMKRDDYFQVNFDHF